MDAWLWLRHRRRRLGSCDHPWANQRVSGHVIASRPMSDARRPSFEKQNPRGLQKAKQGVVDLWGSATQFSVAVAEPCCGNFQGVAQRVNKGWQS